METGEQIDDIRKQWGRKLAILGLSSDMLREGLELVADSKQHVFPVLNAEGLLVGAIFFDDIRIFFTKKLACPGNCTPGTDCTDQIINMSFHLLPDFRPGRHIMRFVVVEIVMLVDIIERWVICCQIFRMLVI